MKCNVHIECFIQTDSEVLKRTIVDIEINDLDTKELIAKTTDEFHTDMLEAEMFQAIGKEIHRQISIRPDAHKYGAVKKP